MKKLYFIAILGISTAAFAQTAPGKVGVNEAAPQATLDIKPNATNLTGTTNEGILIPRLTAARTAATATPVEGTIVYVTDAPADATKFTDTTKGFYYWDPAVGTTPAGRWVKMGAGASGVANLAPAKGSIRTVANILSTDWTATDFTVLISDGSANLQLPDPTTTANNGRIIVVRNLTSAAKSYTGTWTPVNNPTLGAYRGNMLQSNGTSWFNISSF